MTEPIDLQTEVSDPLVPTREWLPGPHAKPGNDPDQTAAEERQKKQFEHFAVDSVHQRYDRNNKTQSLSQTEPTRKWIDGPGYPNDPS